MLNMQVKPILNPFYPFPMSFYLLADLSSQEGAEALTVSPGLWKKHMDQDQFLQC